MKKSNFALRLQPALMEEAKKVAKAEGVAVNQLINVLSLKRSRRCAPKGTSRNAPRKAQPSRHVHGVITCWRFRETTPAVAA